MEKDVIRILGHNGCFGSKKYTNPLQARKEAKYTAKKTINYTFPLASPHSAVAVCFLFISFLLHPRP